MCQSTDSLSQVPFLVYICRESKHCILVTVIIVCSGGSTEFQTTAVSTTTGTESDSKKAAPH